MKLFILSAVALLAVLPSKSYGQQVTVGVDMASYTVSESDGSVEVCVSVQSGTIAGRSFVVGYLTGPFSGSPAADAGGDYTAASGMLMFTDAQQNTPLCVTISITQDSISEQTESFGFLIFNQNNDADLFEDPSSATVFITDASGPTAITIGFQFSDYTAAEGSNAQVCVEVKNNQEIDREVTFSYFTANGNALANADYTPISTTLSFGPINDQQLMCMNIALLTDTGVEGTETFFVRLTTSEAGVTLDPSEATVSIQDQNTVTDPCLSNPCDVNAVCTRTSALNFTCTCNTGFVGDGLSCMAMGGGDDPHFSIVLPSGKLLCFTVQGERQFAFNLISNERVHINALFVPDSVREEVTWMGALGIVVQGEDYHGSNKTSLRFDAKTKQVSVGNKLTLNAEGIDSLHFRDGKLIITEKDPEEDHDYKHPSVCVNLEDLGLHFHVKFFGEHLDIYWNTVTGEQDGTTHGLIGQFFREGVKIDTVRKLLFLPHMDPVPVMRRPVWAFMEREVKDDQLCWTAMNPGYQGQGLIEGTYFDYLVDDVLEDKFVFKN